MKKAPPHHFDKLCLSKCDPTPRKLLQIGHGMDDYDNAEIILLLTVRTTVMRRLMGPCFPTGGLVCTWLFEAYIVRSVNC